MGAEGNGSRENHAGLRSAIGRNWHGQAEVHTRRQVAANPRWRARAVLRHVTAGGSLHVQPGKQRILPLAAHRTLDVGGRCLDQVGAFMPDAGEGVIATLANGPDDHADRAASTFDVEGPTMQTGAGHEQVGAKGRIVFPANTDGITDGPRPSKGKSASVAWRPSPQYSAT
jgi:hypothetical protein